MASRRQDELRSVAPDQHAVWLAGQIDEVESVLIDRIGTLAEALDRNTAELLAAKDQMNRNTSRIVWTILTATITLLISVLAWVATVVVVKP